MLAAPVRVGAAAGAFDRTILQVDGHLIVPVAAVEVVEIPSGGGLGLTVAGRAVPAIQPALRDSYKREAGICRNGKLVHGTDQVIARLEKLSRNEDVQEKLKARDGGWDLIV